MGGIGGKRNTQHFTTDLTETVTTGVLNAVSLYCDPTGLTVDPIEWSNGFFTIHIADTEAVPCYIRVVNTNNIVYTLNPGEFISLPGTTGVYQWEVYHEKGSDMDVYISFTGEY